MKTTPRQQQARDICKALNEQFGVRVTTEQMLCAFLAADVAANERRLEAVLCGSNLTPIKESNE